MAVNGSGLNVFEVRKATVFGRCLDEPIPDYVPSVPITLREMTLKDFSRFREARSLLPERRIMGFAERLKTGQIGIIGFVNGQVACYGWLSLQNETDRWMGVELCLQDGEGYLYDGFIFPAFRGGAAGFSPSCGAFDRRSYNEACIVASGIFLKWENGHDGVLLKE